MLESYQCFPVQRAVDLCGISGVLNVFPSSTTQHNAVCYLLLLNIFKVIIIIYLQHLINFAICCDVDIQFVFL